jgi:predicted hydrolase (HD superfamily)
VNRFELFVVVRNQVSDRHLLRRYIAVEAAMEDLAADLGVDAQLAGLAGLGLGFDAQLCRHNPARLGEVARDLMLTEGTPAAAADAVLSARRAMPNELSPLASGLVIAEALVLAIVGELEEPVEDDDDGVANTIDSLPPRSIARLVEHANPRAREAAAHLGLELETCAARTLAAMIRVRSDLGL